MDRPCGLSRMGGRCQAMQADLHLKSSLLSKSCILLYNMLRSFRPLLSSSSRPKVASLKYSRPPNLPQLRSSHAPQAPRSREPSKSQLPVLPLVAIFCIGSGTFYWMVKTREGQGSSHYILPDRAPPKEQWPRSPKQNEPK